MLMYTFLQSNNKYFVLIFSLILFVIYDRGNAFFISGDLLHSSSAMLIRYVKLITLVLLALLSYYSVACCLFSQSWALRALGNLVFIAGVVNAFTFNVSGSFPDAGLLGTVMQEQSFAPQFVSKYQKQIAVTLFYSLIIIAFVFVAKARLSISCSNRLAAFLLFMAVISNIGLSIYTEGRRSAFYGFNTIIASFKAIISDAIPYVARGAVTEVECSQCPDILFYIVGESVNYEALRAVNSILLQESVIRKRLGVPAFTFKGYSSGNRSSVSNYILRLGLGKSSYPDTDHTTLSYPNIFSYAKSSHYHTIFYNAQAEYNRLQNFMSYHDLVDVDHHITADASTDRYARDLLALDKLRHFVDEAEPNNRVFIMVVNYGIHFPYVNSIPPWLIEELPEGCRSPDISFSSRSALCNHAQYETALKFSVDQYMNKLLGILAGKNFALIYASDHGQNLESSYTIPHGSRANTSECEISVPIFFAGNVFNNVSESGVRSHFQIPPTILRILGHVQEKQGNESTLWKEWLGGPAFLRDPFDQPDRWIDPVGVCSYK